MSTNKMPLDCRKWFKFSISNKSIANFLSMNSYHMVRKLNSCRSVILTIYAIIFSDFIFAILIMSNIFNLGFFWTIYIFFGFYWFIYALAFALNYYFLMVDLNVFCSILNNFKLRLAVHSPIISFFIYNFVNFL